MCERWQTFSFDAYWPLMSTPLKLPGNFQYPPISKPVGPTPAHKNWKRLRNVASPRGTPGVTQLKLTANVEFHHWTLHSGLLRGANHN